MHAWPDLYLFCFAVGALWSVATLLLGGMHAGHHGLGHHAGHAGHSGGHAHHASSAHQWLAGMVNPSGIAVFLAWFGGIGYLLTRHSGFAFWLDITLALTAGLLGAWLLASFLRFLETREKPLDPADYQMVGVLGRVSSTIRPDGVGEVIYVRDGARKPVCARSSDGVSIRRGEEVVITNFEKGIAWVRTWEAMLTQSAGADGQPLQRETGNVE